MNKICEHCGQEMPVHATTCNLCGEPLGAARARQSMAPPDSRPSAPSYHTPPAPSYHATPPAPSYHSPPPPGPSYPSPQPARHTPPSPSYPPQPAPASAYPSPQPQGEAVFCTQCRKQIATGKRFCVYCGASAPPQAASAAGHTVALFAPGQNEPAPRQAQYAEPSANPYAAPGASPYAAQQQPNDPYAQYRQAGPGAYSPAQTPYMSSPPKSGKKRMQIIIASGVLALLIVLAVILIPIITADTDPDAVAIGFVEASFAGNFNRMNRYLAFDMETMLSEVAAAEGMSLNRLLMDEFGFPTLQEFFSNAAAQNRIAFGDDFAPEVRVMNSIPITEREMREILLDIEEDLLWEGIDPNRLLRFDRINEMRELDVEIRIIISAFGINERSSDTFLMVRIGRNWRILEMGSGFFGMW